MLNPHTLASDILDHTGRIHELELLEKGFSPDTKWRVNAENGVFLLRASAPETFPRKTEKFHLLARLHAQGVRCNKPLALLHPAGQTPLLALYTYLPGRDAETGIDGIDHERQYAAGVQAGQDLKKINALHAKTASWLERKHRKHRAYARAYAQNGYQFPEDTRVLRFIEDNFPTTNGTDTLQHDDFHLGNILLDHNAYAGILDFGRYDWGDPLHEFVKLEWFTWPISPNFARGQVHGYFGRRPNPEECRRICVYIAMSLFSTVVWTIRFHPHIMRDIESKLNAILRQYNFFEKTIPEWTL